jgi:hypothetical protein
MGESRVVYRMLVGKAEGKRQLGRCQKCSFDIAMDLQAVGWGVMDWSDLT